MLFTLKPWLVALSSLALLSAGFSASPVFAAAPPSGSLIKGESFRAVYYYSSNGKRYVFPDEKVYKTWYKDFSSVVTISDAELGKIMIGGNVTYRPGVTMVKVESSPNVYVVEKGGVLRWINSETVASALYGSNWNKRIDDIPDFVFANYTVGATVNAATEYNPSTQMASAPTIDVEKGIALYAPAPTASPETSVSAEVDPNDNSDAARPELDYRRPENQTQEAANRIGSDPRYWSAQYGDNVMVQDGGNVSRFGRGCVGTFAQTSTPARGTLIKGSNSWVYYYASNGKRYLFPTTSELQSWYGMRDRYGFPSQRGGDTTACRSVKQVPDSVLAAMPIGGNVPVHAGFIVNTLGTGLTMGSTGAFGEEYSSSAYYLVDAHRTLRRLTLPGANAGYYGDLNAVAAQLYPNRGLSQGDYSYGVLDANLRQDYTLGAPLSDASTWHPSTVTIESELGI